MTTIHATAQVDSASPSTAPAAPATPILREELITPSIRLRYRADAVLIDANLQHPDPRSAEDAAQLRDALRVIRGDFDSDGQERLPIHWQHDHHRVELRHLVQLADKLNEYPSAIHVRLAQRLRDWSAERSQDDHGPLPLRMHDGRVCLLQSQTRQLMYMVTITENDGAISDRRVVNTAWLGSQTDWPGRIPRQLAAVDRLGRPLYPHTIDQTRSIDHQARNVDHIRAMHAAFRQRRQAGVVHNAPPVQPSNIDPADSAQLTSIPAIETNQAA